MMRPLLVAGLAVAAFSFTASVASAACSFEHPKAPSLGRPKKSNSLTSGLVQAFVSCGNPGGNVPNGTTEGGVPSCAPPQTGNQQIGSPTSGWMWDETRAQGWLQFYPNKNRVVNVLNPPNDTVDLVVTLHLRGIVDVIGPADSTGTLAVIARATLDDRANGPMTIVDFPASFPFTLRNGVVSLKTSANALLNGIGQPGLPPCASVEVITAIVNDVNGVPFANMGAFLPEL